MRVMITCGGTGGHITPAIAIADTIKQKSPAAHILFVGGLGGMEERLVTAAGYSIRLLRVVGLPRRPTPSALRAVFLTAAAVRAARHLVAEWSPDLVIGTGGYACYPTLFAAAARGIPTAVHESNAVPGLAVKLLAGRVDRIWLNFREAGERLKQKDKLAVVGNPLPRGCAQTRLQPLPGEGDPMLLSFGGSLGADALNCAVLSLMAEHRHEPRVHFLHATGRRCFADFEAAMTERGLAGHPRIRAVPYIDDMPRQMARATLVIARAGAMTISELAAMRKPAILIPSPNVTGNHQYKNAAALAAAGAARLLREEELQAGLSPLVRELLSSQEARAALAHAIGGFAVPDANDRIWGEILSLTRG